VEPERRSDVPPSVRTPNWTTIALIGGLVLLVLLIAYFATGRNADQDKLTGNLLAQTEQQAKAPAREKLCSSKQTYDLIKRELFRGAAQVRGGEAAAFDQLAGYAVVRMENPVMESEDDSSGAVSCSGSLSLDLPPGVAVAGGRRILSADVDYTVRQAADGSGPAVQLRNAEAIVNSLATLTRVSAPPARPVTEPSLEANALQPEGNAAAAESANKETGPRTSYPGRPSFDCSTARSKGEIEVCSDPALAALDVNMATQYRRAISAASPAQQELLQRTRGHFLAYRDRCPSRSCIADAYVGRMREIRDIMEGRWRPSR
jgi:uncharacterized protein YecT (DUF1311 family)